MDFRVFPNGRQSGRRIMRASEMRAADQEAIQALGVPGIALMENAGRHLADVASKLVARDALIIALCGPGNNGGDGLVAARHLRGWGYKIQVMMSCSADALQGDAATNANAVVKAGIDVSWSLDWTPEDVEAMGPALIIDALLGTGTNGPVRQDIVAVIKVVNRLSCAVVSADLPSGVCADSGHVLGAAIEADHTVTFQASKLGQWLYPASGYCGELHIVDIGMPDAAMTAHESNTWILDDARLKQVLGARRPDTHKGTYGHVGVIGGELGRTGSVHMSADAALVAGAGLVTIGTQKDALSALANDAYEVMVTSLMSGGGTVASAVEELSVFSSLVVGPGFPVKSDWGGRLLDALKQTANPVVVDADALNHAAGRPELLRAEGERVLTPHPGEAARLLGGSSAEVQADRVGSLSRLVEMTRAVVVLKGAHTLIGSPQGEIQVCPYGNPGMATAGMGDVLAGVIGALLAKGYGAMDAACAAVTWHALAGDHARTMCGESGLRARDVISALSEVERCYRD